MIIEYIRHKIEGRIEEFDDAYHRVGTLLDASPHCQAATPMLVSGDWVTCTQVMPAE